MPAYIARGESGALQGLLVWTSRLTVGVGCLFALVSCSVVTSLEMENKAAFLVGVGAIPVFALSTLQSETLRGGGKVFAARVVPTVLQPMLIIVTSLVAGALLVDFTAVSALWSAVAAIGFGLVIQTVAIRRTLRDRAVPAITRLREWLRLGGDLLGVKLFQLILNFSDILLVGILLGPVEAALYTAASRTAVLAGLFTQAVNLAVLPALARAHAIGDLSGLESMLRWSAKICLGPSVV